MHMYMGFILPPAVLLYNIHVGLIQTFVPVMEIETLHIRKNSEEM